MPAPWNIFASENIPQDKLFPYKKPLFAEAAATNIPTERDITSAFLLNLLSFSYYRHNYIQTKSNVNNKICGESVKNYSPAKRQIVLL